VPGPCFDPKKADLLIDAVKVKMNGPIDVRWEAVEKIDREGSGKFKYFKSSVVRPQPPTQS
jgi:hypothetical protein